MTMEEMKERWGEDFDKYYKMVSSIDKSDRFLNVSIKENLDIINKNFDLNISEFITVNFDSVSEVVDQLGGVEIEVDKIKKG